METGYKTELVKRMNEDGKKCKVVVVNTEEEFEVASEFESIEEALHKIELDLMTNLHFGFVNPIQVRIKEREVKE